MLPAQASAPFVIHARHEHGGYPVRVSPSPQGPQYEVLRPEGSHTYPSVRQLLLSLYGGRDPHMTFDKYFRLDKPQVEEAPLFDLFDVQVNQRPKPKLVSRRRSRAKCHRQQVSSQALVFDLFGVPPTPQTSQTVKPMAWADPPLSIKTSRKKRTSANPKLSVDNGSPQLGIDLEKRGHEVRKLLYAGFGARMARAGYDPEDVLQEVYRGILARNKGKCPFDVSKSSFGHYVHMVCSCILANYHRKQSRIAEFEQVGMYTRQGSSEDEWGGLEDASLGATTSNGCHAGMFGDIKEVHEKVSQDMAFRSLTKSLYMSGFNSDGSLKKEATLAVKALRLLYAGHTRSEIANMLGVDSSKVGRALAYLRKVSAEWKQEQGIP